MSKRGAQGPQGSKESNLFEFNMSGTPDDKPQRATAAQLANRKIKDPRKRRTTTAPTNAPTPSFGSPFNSLAPNPAPGPGTQPMSNGFSFGQSQSFPGAGSNPPNQNGSTPFSFGSGTGSSSFNFSSMGGSSTGGNPFATMNTANTTGPSQPPSSGGFSFMGNNFNAPSSNAQPPAQQPTGGIFGSGPQQNNAPGGLFSFGANAPAASKPAPSAPASTGSIFGQSTTSTSAPPFGQQPLAKSPPFGNSTAFGNDSMQTSPDAKSNNLAAKPSIFSGGASTGFGASTNLAGSGTGSIFGSPAKPAETPSKPLDSTPAAPSTPSLFGATTPATTAVGTSSTPAPASTGATPFLFGSPAPAKPAATPQNPFQSTNLFAGAPKAPEQKKEDKPSESPAKNLFQFAPSASGPAASSPSLFSKSETAAAPAAPASGLFQPPSSGSLFAPKPAASAEQDKPKPAEANSNPFGSLFAPKPATPKPATPSQPATEQKPLPSGNPFGSLFAPKPATGETAKPSDAEKPATPAPLFSAPAPSASPLKPATPSGQPASPFGQSSAPTAAPATPPASKTQAPAQPAPTAQANGTKEVSAPGNASGEKAAGPTLKEALSPSRLPVAATPQTAEEVELLHRVRSLNACFQREVAKLDPAKDDFLNVVEFYVRVRETFGAPTGALTTKRKTRDDESEPVNGQPAKKVKALIGPDPAASPSRESQPPAATPASGATSTPATPSGTAPPTPGTGKRKSREESDDSQGSPPKKVNGESSTANIFAQSFSKSKSDSQGEPAQPSTPQTPKLNFSTTPAASPSKPLFPTPATANPPSTANSLFSASASVSKPTFSTPAASSSAASSSPAPSPFTLKPSTDQSAAGAPGSAPAIPKFGSGGGVDFFAQFKSQADKNAEKEKQKRKAEEFDSDEDDEDEWERKDAEQQRKKREEAEARAAKRAKFVPGKGFVFEDEESSDTATKPAEEKSSGASVFENKTAAAPAKSGNIFGHLSATPSEVEEPDNDADDTEEASIDGDENGTTSKDSLFVSASEESSRDVSEAGSKAVSGSGGEISANDSSDDGDISKALKKSKPASPKKGEQAGNRSLMGRVQGSSTPKSQGEEEKKNPFASLFASPKPPSSGTPASTTPNPFAPASKPSSEQSDASASKPATPNLFGAPAPASGLFGSSAASSGAATPSIFAAGQSPLKPAGDNTWKMNSPIKFASDSTPKPDSGSETSASNPSKPFSTLFGAPPAGPKPGSGSSQPQAGFSFGNPSQSSSLLTPSNINSAAASRSTTPGASDTGAESGDADGAEALPQVDFSKGGAGEENEDPLMETRARAMKLKPGSGWESQGVGFLRVLKDRTTSRCRILLRADPSGNIVLNTSLKKEISYTVKGNGVYFIVPQASGTLEQWALRVKAEEASKLGSVLEENKS